MHAFWARVNNTFFLSLLSLGVCALIAALSDFTDLVVPEGGKQLVTDVSKVQLLSFQRGKVKLPYSLRPAKLLEIERSQIRWDLTLDLRDEWHWNTKQIFIWLTADYEANGVQSSVSLWDQIIRDPQESVQTLTNADTKYVWWDEHLTLLGTDVLFTLHWEVHPWVGLMHRHKVVEPFTLPFPSEYQKH